MTLSYKKNLMNKDSLRLVGNIVEDLVEDLNTKQFFKTDIESDDLRRIIKSNSKLRKGFGWIGTPQEEVQNDLATSSCDCPYCCGTIVPDFESTNTTNTTNTTNNLYNLYGDTSPFDAASSEVTDVPFSGDKNIDSLIYPAKWTSKTITYSFFDGGSYYGSEGNVKPITEKMKGYLRDILDKIENFIDVDFREVSDQGSNYGQIRYMFYDGPSTAYTKVPYKYPDSPKAGDIHFNRDKIQDFEQGPGAYRYETLIHETLHALNLKHPGNYNGSSSGNQSGSFLSYGDDNSNNSVMSYNRLRYTQDYSGVITAMAYDMRALQYLYGANNSYNAGNTTYKFSKIDEYNVGNEFFGNPNFNSKQTVWDGGGEDIFDFSHLDYNASGYRFDLRPGGVITSKDAYKSTSYEARGDNSGKKYYATSRGTFLAYNMTIENVITSSSDDYIFANDGANTFGGYNPGKKTGDDVINGSNGKDTLNLSSFTIADFTTINNGYDLVFDFDKNGSITIKDYYKAVESDRIKIITSDTNPSSPNPTPPNPTSPNPTPPAPTYKDGALVWENLNLPDESAVATGSQWNLGNGVTVTVNWQIITDGGSFVPHGGEDFVSYERGKQGNHQGYLSLGFNNSQDDPDDLIKLSINFNQPVTGLDFKVLDVDQSANKYFDDGVEIYADGTNIKDLSAVEIVTGDNVFADNETYMNGFEGRDPADNSSENGNISLNFGSTEVSYLEIKYFSTDDAISNPNHQSIGISDMYFQIQPTLGLTQSS